MKAFLPASWSLICLLTVFNAGAAMAASAPEKPPVSAHAVKSQPHTAVKKATSVKPQPKPLKKRPPIASKSKTPSEVLKTQLPPAKLDLSLPQDMVKQLQPIGTVPLIKHESLLPQLFGEKPKERTPFQLNGRLINNEMQLQMRNDERRDVEGAALEFEFKQ